MGAPSSEGLSARIRVLTDDDGRESIAAVKISVVNMASKLAEFPHAQLGVRRKRCVMSNSPDVLQSFRDCTASRPFCER